MRNLLKVNIKDTRATLMMSFQCHIGNSEQISHFALIFLLLNLNKLIPVGMFCFCYVLIVTELRDLQVIAAITRLTVTSLTLRQKNSVYFALENPYFLAIITYPDDRCHERGKAIRRRQWTCLTWKSCKRRDL